MAILPEAERLKNHARGMPGANGRRVRVSGYSYRESDPGPERTTGIKPIKTAEPRRQEMTVINSTL